MQTIIIDFACPCCTQGLKMELNTWTAKHRISVVDSGRISYRDKRILIEHYKALKGFDKIPTWNERYFSRSMKAAGQILSFFRKTDDALGISKELVKDTANKAKRGGWGWTLETCVKLAGDWIVEKQKKAES